jgi:hypothetical protein
MVFLHIDKKNYKNYPNTNQNPIHKLDDYLNSKKVFILIYMEGCGPCNAVRPEWKKLKHVLKDYSNRNDIAIVDIDKDLLSEVKNIKNHPNSFPTMRYISYDGKIVENYEDSTVKNKDRTIDSFVEWIKLKESNNIHKQTHKRGRQIGGKTRRKRGGKWSLKYKRSINCKHPKGFSQKQHCKYGRKK